MLQSVLFPEVFLWQVFNSALSVLRYFYRKEILSNISCDKAIYERYYGYKSCSMIQLQNWPVDVNTWPHLGSVCLINQIYVSYGDFDIFFKYLLEIFLQCSAVQCSSVECIALHCIALHCIALHCIAVQCSAIRWWVSYLWPLCLGAPIEGQHCTRQPPPPHTAPT